MQIKVLIVEDEILAAQHLEKLVQNSGFNINVVAVLESVSQTVAWLQQNAVDLIFMDIHLADGISFKIFELVHVQTPVIFTTAYDAYAIQAFKVNSVDYLLKPIDKAAVYNALEKYFNTQSVPNAVANYLKIADFVGGQVTYQQRILVSFGDKLKSIKVDEVAYVYSESKAVFLTTFQKREYALTQTLDKVEASLDPNSFFRVNRKFLVRFEAIAEMQVMSRSRVRLVLKPTTEEEVLVSFNKSATFREWLNMKS